MTISQSVKEDVVEKSNKWLQRIKNFDFRSEVFSDASLNGWEAHCIRDLMHGL